MKILHEHSACKKSSRKLLKKDLLRVSKKLEGIFDIV